MVSTKKAPLVEEVVELPGTHWRDAIASGIRGIHLKALTPEMLDDEGVIIQVGKDPDLIDVRFDSDFVCQYIMDRMLEPLGLITKEGKVKLTYLTQTLIPMLVQYSESTAARELEDKIRTTAALMSAINGLSIEENIERIRVDS